MKNTIKNKCNCNGTGQVVVCSLCEEGIKHSSCDDTYVLKCSCKNNKKNKKNLKCGL